MENWLRVLDEAWEWLFQVDAACKIRALGAALDSSLLIALPWVLSGFARNRLSIRVNHLQLIINGQGDRLFIQGKREPRFERLS